MIDCVEGGAPVSFMHPLPLASALAPALALALAPARAAAAAAVRGERALLLAELGRRIVATMRLLLAQPDDQPHRADLRQDAGASSGAPPRPVSGP